MCLQQFPKKTPISGSARSLDRTAGFNGAYFKVVRVGTGRDEWTA